MKNLPQIWRALESPPGPLKSAAEWKQSLGSDFEILKAFLNLKQGLAGSVPCPNTPSCGCYHTVTEHGRDDIVAVCSCEPRRCPTTQIKREDALIYELNLTALGKAVAGAFSFKPEHKSVPEIAFTQIVGSWSPRPTVAIPVYLTIQCDTAEFQHVVEKLIATTKSPFILMSPTGTFPKNETNKLLREHSARSLVLESVLAWNGTFIATETFENIFSEFLEDVAPAKELYLLHKEGKTWRAVFEGETNNILDSKGVDYIATLLANPHKSIPCVELYGAVLVPFAEVSGEFVDDDYQQILEKTKTLNVDAVSDKQTRSDCKKRIAEIETKIEIASDTGNTDGLDQLENEKKALEQEIARSEGLHGKLRVKGNPEKARQAVTRAVERAIKSMEKQHPKLWAHLSSTVQTGNALIYKPDRAIRWVIKCS